VQAVQKKEVRDAQAALRHSERRFRALFDSMFQFTVLLAADGTVLEINQAALGICGLTSDSQAIGSKFWEVPWPAGNDVLARLRAAAEAAARGEFVREEHEGRRSDGGRLIVDVSTKPAYDDDGRLLYVIAEGRDVTHRKMVEESLAESEDRFRSAMQFSAIGMCLVSTEGRFLSVNRSLCRITGYAPAELLDRDFQSITHPDDLASDLELLRRVLSGELDSYQLDKRYIHKQGHVIWCLLTVSLVRGKDGELLYFVSQVQDVTDRKRAELELAELNAKLEARVHERTHALLEANAELEAFCYSVSHDLRAPLRHINGYAAMLAEDCARQMPPQAEQHLRSISDASRQMGGLIDDLLSFSRAGRTEAAEGELDLDELVSEVVRAMRAGGGDRAIEWKVEPLPRVVGDRSMIRQVFANLIDNAIKYTQPQPLARIEIGCVGEDDGRAIIAVHDNGVGFDMQYADKLFGVFQRLHHIDEFEGTGVGLANVRRIIARHGGRAWAEAEPGMGASFYFTLTIAR